MKIKNGKDFWAGTMFIGFGLVFILVALDYPMGSAVSMGPAYFPTVLGGLLAFVGAIVLFRSFFSKLDHPFKVFTVRALLLVASLVVGCGTYFADSWLKGMPMVQFGLVALALILIIGAFGPRAMFLILLAVMIFGYALKPLGLVLATVILIVLSAVGGHDFRKKEIVFLTVGLAILAVLVFVKGLGLPFNLWPGE